jgi:hypothetical protein
MASFPFINIFSAISLILDLYSVNCYYCVRANCSTAGASGTCVWVSHITIVISPAVYLFGKGNSMSGAILHTYAATFAFFGIDYDSSFYCHYFKNLVKNIKFNFFLLENSSLKDKNYSPE